MLIAEDEDGTYEPICVASSINEGKEMAQSDLRGRMQRLDHDQESDLCPCEYKLWARGVDGTPRIAASWLATEL